MTAIWRLLARIAMLVATTAIPAYATIIDVDSKSPFGVTLALDPGTYSFAYIGIADGGKYDAWTAWNDSIQPCDGPCPTGFINELRIEGLGPAPLYIGDHFNPIWPTAAEALHAAQANYSPFTLTITQATVIRFLVGEGAEQGCATGIASVCWADNSGGISLLTAVPETNTFALLLSGLVALAAVAKSSRKPV